VLTYRVFVTVYRFGKFLGLSWLTVFLGFHRTRCIIDIGIVLIVNSCSVHASRSSWTIMWKHVFRSTIIIILVNPELSRITMFLAKCLDDPWPLQVTAKLSVTCLVRTLAFSHASHLYCNSGMGKSGWLRTLWESRTGCTSDVGMIPNDEVLGWSRLIRYMLGWSPLNHQSAKRPLLDSREVRSPGFIFTDTYNTERYIVSTRTLRSRIIALDVKECYRSRIRASGNVRVYPKDISDRARSWTT